MEATKIHVIQAYKHNPRWQPGEPRRERFSQPIAACGNEQAADELISIYEARHDPDALAAEEAKVTCQQCREWLADEDNRLKLLDTDAWIRKHVAAGDKDIRYIDIPASDG